MPSWRNRLPFRCRMCGDAQPEKCVAVLENAFNPGKTAVSELLRGREVAHQLSKPHTLEAAE